ncbi:DNA polymerase II [Reinekea forsetii]|nr:DNA polymerase II [Reinekea forsetii]
MSNSQAEFILSRHWSENEHGIELRYWLVSGDGVRCWQLEQQESTCFIAQHQLKKWQTVWAKWGQKVRVGQQSFKTFSGLLAIAVYSKSFSQQRRWVRQGRDIGLLVWEDDVNPADRFLMERFLFGGVRFQDSKAKPAHASPSLKVLSIDIETSWYTPGQTPNLYSIALATTDNQQAVFIVGEPKKIGNQDLNVSWCQSVSECLLRCIEMIQLWDPDCIVGWNVVDFDLRILQQHCDQQGIEFQIGRDKSAPRWRTRSDNPNRHYIDVEGRQIVDGPGAFRSAAWAFESYSLETVSQSLLNRGKQIAHTDDKVDEIERMYREDTEAFARYNLEDAVLVIELFHKAGLWHFLIERAHLTGLSMDRAGGSSAAFNTVYMPRLHRQGYIAPSIGDQTLQLDSPGGFVMDSQPGLYQNVLVLDFKSLYPSIIRTFLIDPLGLQIGLSSPESETVEGFISAKFHRENHILPALIDQLWQARDVAKQDNNQPMSQAIKIIMNSFYGVLGSQLCRFFDPRLASSITMRGHQILQESRQFIEQQGYKVIYGDTDSIFVHANQTDKPEQLGTSLAQQLNLWWQQRLEEEFNLPCHLEMEFETHYREFIMPTIRGTETGSKKRYAGIQVSNGEEKLVFKGLEAVRSDWTKMAKNFQIELYRRVFAKEDHRQWVIETVSALKTGQLDDQLVYRRRLRRSVEEYQKQRPPHVQAAALKQQLNPKWRGRTIDYVKTVNGWQPKPYVTAALDYDHYIEKQIEPIADAILHFLGESFKALIDEQLSLF